MATIIGFLFFLLVLFAALTSAISLGGDARLHCARRPSVHARQGPRHRHRVRGHRRSYHQCGLQRAVVHRAPRGGSSILDFADFISNSVLMPIVALLTCVFVGWIVKPKTIIDEVRVLRPVQGRAGLDDHDQVHRPGVGDYHSGRLRGGSVRLLFHVNRAGQRDFHGEGRPCGRSSLFCGRIVNY